MKFYQTSGNMHLTEVQSPTAESNLIKIKVTHVLVSESDVSLFSGQNKLPFPITIGKIAIGVVSDDRLEYNFKRGQKVILNPYVEPDVPGKPIRIRGMDCDGFLSDYVFLERDRIIEFPDIAEFKEINEKDAVFAYNVATALNVLKKYKGGKSGHIAIVGSDATSCIIAQLAVYFQYIPIMIDSDEKRLNIAKSKGIYYTVNSTKEVPYNRVKDITGGRMVDMSVINLNYEKSPGFLFSITKEGGTCVVLSDSKTTHTVDADISLIGKRRLVVEGINESSKEMDSAVNILVQGILDLDGFIDKEVTVKDAELCFRELTENPEQYYGLVIRM